MPTIRQLAKLAGVSSTTVWAALHNQPGVSAETRQRIRELAETYHYRIPPISRHSLRERCGFIGYVIPPIPLFFHSKIFAAIVAEAYAESYQVIPLQLPQLDMCHVSLALETLVEQRVDGLLLDNLVNMGTLSTEVLLDIASHGIPFICFSDDIRSPLPYDRVGIDEERVGQIGIEHLFTFGHREITYVGEARANPRLRAVVKAARKYGITLKNIGCGSQDLIGTFTDTYRQQFLPTAFMCQNDYYAVQVLHYLQHHGLRVPGDISVLSCCDLDLAIFTDPMFSSIDVSPYDIGRRAFALLLQRINERSTAGFFPTQAIPVEPRLVIRQSCAPPLHQRMATGWDCVTARMPALASPCVDTKSRRPVSQIAWRSEDTTEALEERFREETAAELQPRWQMLWLLRQGYSRCEVAQTLGIHLRTLCKWLAWYREGGVAAVAAHQRGGLSRRQCRLSETQCQRLADHARQEGLSSIHQACAWVERTYGVCYSYWGMRDLLERLGLRERVG